MRLSDAIATGRTLICPNEGSFTLYCGQGCAMGMGLAAMGESIGDHEAIRRYWPWVTLAMFYEISQKYFAVVRGEQTLDQLIDWVRSIEPPEPEESPAPVLETEQETVEVRRD